ncbi:MAG TPA: hypothetical protein VLJ38_06795 [Polyangiaceae bacterium]|jgi:hypothetical protein|nr:hypothetical protein [Polyangiaceae bacterium]
MYPDFEELLAELNSAGAEYLIGGAHAVAFHARPRATKDLDLYIGPGRRNAARVVRAIAKFFGGAAPSYVSVEHLSDPTVIIQLGVAPVRVDLLPRLFTIDFSTAWKRRVLAPFGEVPANYLALEDLMNEKRHFARTQDLADLEQLERAARHGRAVKPRRARTSKRPARKGGERR